MATAFVSYRRKPSAILAQLIAKDLKTQGIEVYLDIERMENAGAFPSRLFQAIDASDVFVCLLGDDTLESEWVQNEIQHAHEAGKPMIPVFQESFEPFPLDQAPTPYVKALLEYDGVHIFDVKNVYVPQAVEALARMIENTAAWAKQQTPSTPDPSQVPILSVNIEALTGQQFGQYQITELLGIGGMSAVYKAHQESLMRDVALKVLPPSVAAQPSSLERFLREARTAAALEHAHIVPVYDYGNYGGLSFVVMRLLAGGTLGERLTLAEQTGSPLPSLHEVAEILRHLAGAMDYAHSRGVIHRDIKANNVMFDDQGSPYLVDFGIAKLTHAVNSLTGTGVAMGTPLYMSPEQWRGESVTPATDQYALGVTTYAMLTGHLPFEAPTPYALMHKHLNEQPPPLDTWRDDLPPTIKKVIDQAMAKKPSDRFPSAKAFAEAFAEAVEASGVENQPTGFFTVPLPDRQPPPTSPLVGGTPDPSASPVGLRHPTPPPVIDQGGGTPLPRTGNTPGQGVTPPPQPVAHAPTPSTPAGEDLPLTNPEATLPSGSQTPNPPPVIPQGAVTPPPGYIHQITPSGQSIFVQQSTPMDQAQIMASHRPSHPHLIRWVVLALVALAALGLIGLVTLTQNQQQATIAQTQAAINATGQAVELQLTIDNATLTAQAGLPTATPTATATATQTATVTPATPVVQAVSELTARLGPGTNYPEIATLTADGKLDILGISEDGAWYQVILSDGTLGWVITSGSLVNVFGDVGALAVVSPPTETPSATATASPTSTPTRRLTPTPTMTASPTPPPELGIGGRARVSAGEFGLALRSEAGDNFGLVVNVPDGASVDILDGPQTVAGRRWWRVRSPEGQIGWAAEESNDRTNLIPIE